MKFEPWQIDLVARAVADEMLEEARQRREAAQNDAQEGETHDR